MWTAAAAQRTTVSLARHDAHGPPWQTAPQKAVLHPKALTHPGCSASSSRAAIISRVASTPMPQPKLLDRLEVSSHSRQYRRQFEHGSRPWPKRFVFCDVDLTDFPPVQLGLPQSEGCSNPLTARSRAGRHSQVWCPRNYGMI